MFAPDVVYSSRNRTPTPFPLLAGMNFCASAFKGAAILFVLYQSIACRARHRFCDRAEPDSLEPNVAIVNRLYQIEAIKRVSGSSCAYASAVPYLKIKGATWYRPIPSLVGCGE
jgi:hypothetical protein